MAAERQLPAPDGADMGMLYMPASVQPVKDEFVGIPTLSKNPEEDDALQQWHHFERSMRLWIDDFTDRNLERLSQVYQMQTVRRAPTKADKDKFEAEVRHVRDVAKQFMNFASDPIRIKAESGWAASVSENAVSRRRT